MSMDKIEGILIGIGAGIVAAAILEAYEQVCNRPINAANDHVERATDQGARPVHT